MKEGPDEASELHRIPSFSEIFKDYMPFLWRTTLALGVPQSDAEDVCQEVMLVVHRRLADFDGRALKSWLYGICLRVTSDYRRSARVRRERSTDSPPDRELPATQIADVAARRAEARLKYALDALDDDRRAAFVLFEIEQLTLKEIAEATGAPLQTVYSRLQAARAHVRGFFQSLSREGATHEVG